MHRPYPASLGFSFIECCVALLFSAAAAQLFFASHTTTARSLQQLRDQQTAKNILQNLYHLDRDQLRHLQHQAFDAYGLPTTDTPAFSLTVDHHPEPPLLHVRFHLTLHHPHQEPTTLSVQPTLWQEQPQ